MRLVPYDYSRPCEDGRLVDFDGRMIDMALSIKNQETERIVRELADLRGVSLVTAIAQSAQETLDRDRATAGLRQNKKGLAEHLRKIARETGPLMHNGKSTKELFDELYDEETGLPK